MLQAGEHSDLKPWDEDYAAVKRQLGEWTVTIEGWEDTYTSWLHDARIKVQVGDERGERPGNRRRDAQPLGAHRGRAPVRPAIASIWSRPPNACRTRNVPPRRVWPRPTTHASRRCTRRTRCATASPRAARSASRSSARSPASPPGTSSSRVRKARTAPRTARSCRAISRPRSPVWTVPPKRGFDIVYLPPIFPIGVTNRKGRNNSLVAARTTRAPRSASAPSSAAMTRWTRCWVRWTTSRRSWPTPTSWVWRSRSTSRCSAPPTIRGSSSIRTGSASSRTARSRSPRNPPKKYQDIYPIDFNADMPGIEREVERIMNLWIEAGVTIFRIDNPHTKPVRFWQDVIAAVTKKHPEVLFLAEAFTPPGHDACVELCGLHAVALLLPVAQHQGGAGRVPARNQRQRRLLPAQHLLAHHAGHPDRLRARQRHRRPRRARGAGRHGIAPRGASTTATS